MAKPIRRHTRIGAVIPFARINLMHAKMIFAFDPDKIAPLKRGLPVFGEGVGLGHLLGDL